MPPTPCLRQAFLVTERHLETRLEIYFGALVNWVKLQSTAAPGDKLLFSVLTLPQDHSTLLPEAWTTMMAPILAPGVDPQKSVVFHQDEIQKRRLDSELSDTDREVETDDDVEDASGSFEKCQ